MVSPDPKHGRWILPLIIAAMVVLTFTFVNSIDPTDTAIGAASTQPEPPFPTEPTSSTSSLPPEAQAFVVTLDVFDNQAITFADEVGRVNDQWEARELTLDQAADAFEGITNNIRIWETDVADTSQVPDGLGEAHVQLVIESADLAPKVQDIIAGLRAPDDGTLRRTAVSEFAAEIQQVRDAIQTLRGLAGGSSPTTETTIPADPDAPTTTIEIVPEDNA